MSNIIEALKAEAENSLQDAKEAKDQKAIIYAEMCLECLETLGYALCVRCERYHQEHELIGAKYEDKKCAPCHAKVEELKKSDEQQFLTRHN